ncbi:hypothetical protein RIF23_07175 [Lipingzhangella sp. LS1_29]|uniref:Uncharacterized protein n=1 Tax=Lipingzhangella rawalii TaxID=2055835 RepID=A0ABU2H438_9ACTN|nr:hypothetical protein [Lipingzhangella rawalii]MDS1270072.1 hypothetical protein [Lipingzhangella rawalii]
MGRDGVRGAFGSHDRPASALWMRLGLALFGVAVLGTGAVLAWVWAASVPLTVVLSAGTFVAALNVYWVGARIRGERR